MSFNRQFVSCSLGLWLVVNLVISGLLALAHNAQLPLNPPAGGPAEGRWSVLHILALQCQCSQRVLAHLEERGALPDWSEAIALVNATSEAGGPLEDRGFEVSMLPADELENFCGQVAVPLLIVRDPDGNALYAGAYAAGPQQPPQDQIILAQLRAGKPVARLANTGCAVSRGLQRKVDPLGFKMW